MYDMDAIFKKVQGKFDTNSGKKELMSAVKRLLDSGISLSGSSSNGGLHSPQDAAEKFISVLQQQIRNSDIPQSLKDVISSFEKSTPVYSGNGRYSISVSNKNSTSYRSPYEEGYPEGISDIVLLYNDGMSARDYVYGYRNGKRIRSKKTIDATNIIDNAIKTFMDNYSKEYGVSRITILR